MIALKDSEQIRGVITLNEQAAAFMACGYAMFTDNLEVCFTTSGAGGVQYDAQATSVADMPLTPAALPRSDHPTHPSRRACAS